MAGAGRLIAAAIFPLIRVIVRVAVGVCFRRVATLHRERLPGRGPVLVAANHPAAWSDVVVLDVALRRRLHFIAHQPLFTPRPRGLLLELFGTLPVWRRAETPDSVTHNEETFERCRALFRRGEVIAMFPEGVSGGDRDLLPLRIGAAHLLLEHTEAGAGRPTLVPVAIRYDDRTRFRTPAVVAVGPPIPWQAHRPGAPGAEQATAALTAEMARGITAALGAAAAHACAASPGHGPRPTESRVLASPLEAAAAFGAAAGRALHAIPLWAIERIARALAGLPQQISFARMVTGLILVPLWYALLAGAAALLGGGAWFALPASAPWLGLLACRDHDRRYPEGRKEQP